MPPQPAPNLFFFKEKTYFNLVNTYTSINVHTLHVFTKIRRRYWIPGITDKHLELPRVDVGIGTSPL
ncbi:mCG1030520 [Mus musculus]|nr:mCG1030520 [Mus musculus]